MQDSNERGGGDAARVGGAAADFIAGLGRKTAELRVSLQALQEDPTRQRGREELRRKLHALGVGARLLHLNVLAQAVGSATHRIDESAAAGRLSDALLRDLDLLLTKIPELAWQKAVVPPPVAERTPGMEAAARAIAMAPVAAPWTVLVVGAETLALALEDDPASFPCELERTTEVATALDLARAVAPDLVVVDVDLEGTLDLVAALGEDMLTGPVPVVAVGRAAQHELLAKLVALGVAKVMSKPVAPGTLREACSDVVGERSRALPAALHPEIGEVTAEELADRIAAEVRRLLVDDLEPFARDRTVSLGIGAEILGPVWGAIARVRDVVRERSQGAIVFRDDRLRRPIAVPGVGHEDRRGAARGRSGRPEVDLEGRTIVVADDDAAIATWIAGALREAGATVHEVPDGQFALESARRHDAAAIVTDVLMPRLDGISLSRALRRDVALRDRPVVLLSWKEDLLQRLRDLRVESSATLRKDDDAQTIAERVREVLSPRVRIEARVAGGAEVRGRLDDLTVASLLSITNRVRHEACVVIRDAAHVFEVELEGGSIHRVSRTGADGSFARGSGVVASLLGVIGGRFLVRAIPARTARDASLVEDELQAQLAPVLRTLRAACDAVSGVQTIEIGAVAFDTTLLASYLPATPTLVRRILERIADGSSPRSMILGGDVAPALLEDVLVDAASRGLVVKVTGAKGDDLLAAAASRLEGPAPEREKSKNPQAVEFQSSETPIEFSLESLVPPPPAAPRVAKPTELETAETMPGSLADAVLQISSAGEMAARKPLIDTRDLTPRRASRSDPPERISRPRSKTDPSGGPVSGPVSERRAPASQTLAGIGEGANRTPSNRPRENAPEKPKSKPDSGEDPD